MEKQKKEKVFEFVLPTELNKDLVDKISHEVKESYYWEVGKQVAKALQTHFESDGFAERIAKAVLEKVKMEESEYTTKVTEVIKQHLFDTIGIIAKETLTKIQEKVKSYGFIKIGSTY